MAEVRRLHTQVHVTFRSYQTTPPSYTYILVPMEPQLHLLPTLNDVELNNHSNNNHSNNSSNRNDNHSGNITVLAIKESVVVGLREKYGWVVEVADVILASDGVVLYDTWVGNDFGLGSHSGALVSLSYRCLDLKQDATFNNKKKNKKKKNKNSSVRPPCSPSLPMELATTNDDDDTTNNNNNNRGDLRAAAANVQRCLQEVRSSAQQVHVGIGAVFKQVSRDLDMFVRHLLKAIENRENGKGDYRFITGL
jgi:hypothetical protein